MFDKSKLAVAALFVAAAELLTNGAARADTTAELLSEEQLHEQKMSVPGHNQLWVCASLAFRDFNKDNAFGENAFVYQTGKYSDSKAGMMVSVVFDPQAVQGNAASTGQTFGFQKGLNIVEGQAQGPAGAINENSAARGHLLGYSGPGSTNINLLTVVGGYSQAEADEMMGFAKPPLVKRVEGMAGEFAAMAQKRCQNVLVP